VTAPTTAPEIERYLAAVRAALADLSTEDREDLMEDVASHLADVAAEGRGTLEDRLGKPWDYAAELRSAAGLPVAGRATRQSWSAGLSAAVASSPVGRALAAASENRQVRDFRGFLPELRPGWWVLRGYLAVLLLSAVFGEGSAGIIPRVGNSALLGLLLTMAAMWGSVRLGRRWQAHPPGKRWAVAGAVTAVVLGVFFLATGFGFNRSSSPDVYYGPPPESASVSDSLTNIYAFDADGHPLTGVQLFDQDGKAINVTASYDANGNELHMQRRFTVSGVPVDNVFPRQPADGIGQAPPFAPPRLAPTAGPSPSPSVAPSGGASPVPTPTPTPTPSPR
jgi:hypothetical protein